MQRTLSTSKLPPIFASLVPWLYRASSSDVPWYLGYAHGQFIMGCDGLKEHVEEVRVTVSDRNRAIIEGRDVVVCNDIILKVLRAPVGVLMNNMLVRDHQWATPPIAIQLPALPDPTVKYVRLLVDGFDVVAVGGLFTFIKPFRI